MRGALVRSADAFFANCPLGLDLRQADFSGSGGLSPSSFSKTMGRVTAASPPKVPVGGRGQGRVGSPHYRAISGKACPELVEGRAGFRAAQTAACPGSIGGAGVRFLF